MTDPLRQGLAIFENLPVVGGFLKRARREAVRTASGLSGSLPRDALDIDAIVARIDIDAIVARLDIGEVVDRLDIDAIVARIDIDAIVARLDIDEVVARLNIDEVVARIDFNRLAGQIVQGVDLPNVVRKSATSLVRGRKPPAAT